MAADLTTPTLERLMSTPPEHNPYLPARHWMSPGTSVHRLLRCKAMERDAGQRPPWMRADTERALREEDERALNVELKHLLVEEARLRIAVLHAR